MRSFTSPPKSANARSHTAPPRVNARSVCIAHSVMARGGSEAIAMWGMQALSWLDSLHLLTAGRPDLREMNLAYGTRIDPTRVTIRRAPRILGLGRLNDGAAMRGSRFQRYCRSIASQYDTLISAYNLCDFGLPAIHFVADFCWDEELRRQYDAIPTEGARLVHRNNLLRKGYLALARRIASPSGRDLFSGEDLIVANSRWTADILQRKYGAECEVVYPPVVSASTSFPWQQRENGFVCLGRIAPEKRIEQLIDILARVRQLGHNIHLHIIGPLENDPYGRMIRQRINQNQNWIFAEGRQVGEAKENLLTGHKYAIHACAIEAFGIAVAEQVQAGCIPFVPNSGGQTEIVNHKALCYTDLDDAVRKIDMVLRSEPTQHRLREHLQQQGRQFSAERFMREFRDIVERFRQQQTAANKG